LAVQAFSATGIKLAFRLDYKKPNCLL